MAEQRRVRSDGGQAAADPPPLTAAEVGRYGIRQIAELTGKEPEGVTGVEPTEDGWLVTIEVVETRRIPASTDLLATYETEIGPDGELVSYRRVRRYGRGRGDSFGDGS
jgi:Gas vesicle synthesis protein GvpO